MVLYYKIWIYYFQNYKSKVNSDLVDGVLTSFLRKIRDDQDDRVDQDDGVDQEVVCGVLQCIKKNYSQVFWKVVGLFEDRVGERVCEICGGREDIVVEYDVIKDGVEEQVVEQVEVDVLQDEMVQNRVVGEHVGMELDRKKEFESPLAKRPFSSALLSKGLKLWDQYSFGVEAIGQTPPKHARFESLFEEVVALSALLESKQESLVTTSTRIYRLLRKSKSDLCNLPIGSLFRAIGSRIKSDVDVSLF